MMCFRWLVAACLLCAVPFGSSQAADSDPPLFSVGVAAVDITPDYPIRLNGFLSRNGESTGVRQQIWAKALAIGESADDVVVILTVDGLGIPDDFADRVSRQLQEKFSLPRERLAITSTHTHSAPMIVGCTNLIFGKPIPADQWKRVERYTAELEEYLVEVAGQALRTREPSRLSHGVGTAKFGKNRRSADGPVDHDLPMLAVHDQNNKLRAVLTTYATHAVNLSDDLINGDWPGYAAAHIERLNPGCTALISVGCGADSNPLEGVVHDRAEVPDSHGVEIAEEIQRLLAGGLTPLTKAPTAKFHRIDLPLAPLPTRGRWEKLAEQQNPTGYHARVQLERLDKGEPLMESISYPVQSFAFADELAMVFLPGEVVVDYAKRLKQEFQGSRLWLHAYSNACPGYVPSERVLTEGGYEGGRAMIYYDIPGPYAAGLEQKIVDAVHEQLPQSLLSTIDVEKTQGTMPKSPQQSLASLRVKPGFRAELVAAEPLVQSPVTFAAGPDGRLWVAEMWDYPSGVDGEYGPGGRVRCLLDDDGDGQYDRSQIFLDGIPFPTGVTVWRDGVLVCAAPDILYAEDTDGDGKADVVRKLFSGFATHNYQARVNALEYGLDGWVYGSCGLFGGEITSHLKNTTMTLGSRDFRINPDTGDFEAVAARSQQGRVRNDWGDWFGCTNGSPLLHFPLEGHYLERNPFLKPPSILIGLAAEPEPGRLYPISDQVLFKLSGPPGRPTAACGVGVYRDRRLGTEYFGNTFTCEPVNNLVHRQILTRSGSTFTSRRGSDELNREFLASTDPWFRPVQARTGPDGGLWVVDMYRFVIEHPMWIPPETLEELDPRAGADMGRIYRVVPADSESPAPVDLTALSTEELADALATPNGPQRDLIQQMLRWRNDRTAIPRLAAMAADADEPEVRLQALCSWALLEPPTEDALLKAMADAHPAVRRHGVRLSESRLNESPKLGAAVADLAADADPAVRIQVAYSLGEWNDPEAATRLAELLTSEGADAYQQAAAKSSFRSGNISGVLEALDRSSSGASNGLLNVVSSQAASLADTEIVEALAQKLAESVTESQTPQAFHRFASFMEGWGRRDAEDRATQSAGLNAARSAVTELALSIAEDEDAELPLRTAAVEVLGHAPSWGESHAEELASLLTPQTPPALHGATLAALGRHSDASLPELLTEQWEAYTPALRKGIVVLLLSRPDWTKSLLVAVQQQTLTAADFDLSQQQGLLNHPDEEIRKAAEQSLQTMPSGARQDVVDRYVAGLKPHGQESRGMMLFEKHCAVCHKLKESDAAVGPDIVPYAGKPAQSLLIAMLAPNQAVDPRYQSYAVMLKDGRTAAGLIAEESATGLTLVAADGKRRTILRGEVEEMRNTGKSLMPEGFEQHLSTDDVSDLWAYVRSWRLEPKSLPGNSPALVDLPPSGPAVLPAAQAEIHGGDITFEAPFQNVGYWHGADDFVRWRIKSPTIRELYIWGEWACAPDAAGNTLRVEGADPAVERQIASTGGWNRFQLVRIGTVRVAAGESELVVRPAGPVNGALADLRALHLVPPGTVPEAAGRVEPRATTSSNFSTADVIAAYLLDDDVPTEDRQKLIPDVLDQAAAVIREITDDLPEAEGGDEEYRRIPWIWRLAIAVGKANRPEQVREVLKVSLPSADAPLRDWQAVVIGGGIINGISLSGPFPGPVIEQLLRDDPDLWKRWRHALNASVVMADDASVRSGTRYDALRMLALLGWSRAADPLLKYLKAGTSGELQMGSVSGLADVQDPRATDALLDGLNGLTDRNRSMALDALLRTDDRCTRLLQAVAEKKITVEQIGPERVERLRMHPNAEIREEAGRVLGE